VLDNESFFRITHSLSHIYLRLHSIVSFIVAHIANPHREQDTDAWKSPTFLAAWAAAQMAALPAVVSISKALRLAVKSAVPCERVRTTETLVRCAKAVPARSFSSAATHGTREQEGIKNVATAVVVEHGGLHLD
jgi:hypothetical protein